VLDTKGQESLCKSVRDGYSKNQEVDV
jgi:hypothetical protein